MVVLDEVEPSKIYCKPEQDRDIHCLTVINSLQVIQKEQTSLSMNKVLFCILDERLYPLLWQLSRDLLFPTCCPVVRGVELESLTPHCC